MQPERLGKEPASDAGPTAPEAAGRPAPTRRLKWLATAGLAVLIALTSLAVARVNVWFVPPYLILMGWILLGPRAAGPRSLAEAEAEFQKAQSIPPQPTPPTPTPPPIPTPPEPDPAPEPEPDPPPRRRLFGRSRRVDPARADAVPEPSSDLGAAPSEASQPRASAVRGWFSRKSRASSLDDPEAEEQDPGNGTEAGASVEAPAAGPNSPSSPDDPSSTGTTTKARRRRKKKVEAPPEPPTEVAWVRIGPNQFVRQETPLPNSEESDPPAEPADPGPPPPPNPGPATDPDAPHARLLAPTPGPGSTEARDTDGPDIPSNDHSNRTHLDTDKEAGTSSIELGEPSRPDPVAEAASLSDPAAPRPDALADPSVPDDEEPARSPADRGAWGGEPEEGDPTDDPSDFHANPQISNHHDEAIGRSHDDPRLERRWDDEPDDDQDESDDDDHEDPRLERRWDEEPDDEEPTGSPSTPLEGQGPWGGESEEGDPTDDLSDTHTNPQISNHRDDEAIDPTDDDPRLERRWEEESDDEETDEPNDEDQDDPRLERRWDEEPDDAGPGDPRDDLADEPVGRDDREDGTSSSSSDGEEDEEDWYDDEGDDEDRWGASAAELAESIVSDGRRDHEDEDGRGPRPDDDRSDPRGPGDPSPAASAIPNGGGSSAMGRTCRVT